MRKILCLIKRIYILFSNRVISSCCLDLNEISLSIEYVFGVIMSAKPEYTGLDKYPGWIATGITILIGVVFIGALVMSAGDHGGDHSGEHSTEKAH